MICRSIQEDLCQKVASYHHSQVLDQIRANTKHYLMNSEESYRDIDWLRLRRLRLGTLKKYWSVAKSTMSKLVYRPFHNYNLCAAYISFAFVFNDWSSLFFAMNSSACGLRSLNGIVIVLI